ncbi:MAG: capsular biosynthesis protein [Sphingomonadales bacterium]|nr:capsular biosynthesis protein [Sphingomonadales bacterium]MBD3774590.1 capsular biosynthesis protein [Paracoccaceae bacterium]
MTEHTKIPLPGEDPEKGNGNGQPGSLFERASGTFGFDAYRAAPVPKELAEAPMKRAKKVVRKAERIDDAPAPQMDAPVAREDVQPAPPVDVQPVLPVEATMPVPVPPGEMMLSKGFDAISFSGATHKVDRKHLREQGLIVPEGGVTGLLEEFRIVKRQILSSARNAGTAASRRVLVCSPLPGEGKTFCATNLAISMAHERDGEVLLVDADFAKPSILSVLGLPKGPGFMDALADPSIKVEELVMGTDIPGLWVLPAGNQTNADAEYLASTRTGEVLDRLTMGAPHRMVIFDSAPALAASPAAELAKHVGQALLIARADRTGQNALEDAYQLLSACPDIKLLLNAAHFSPSGRRFGSYYGYEG